VIDNGQIISFNKFLTELRSRQENLSEKVKDLAESLLIMEVQLNKFNEYLRSINEQDRSLQFVRE
jgi:hypothetical protein